MMARRSVLRWVLAANLVAVTIGLSPTFAADGIHWYDYEEGTALMQREGKKGYLNFYAEWCKYCKLMDEQTFSNTAVVAYLNRNFVAMKVDSDKETKMAADFGVQGLPSNWFLTASGERISNRPGFIPPKEMLNILKFINTDSYEQMSFGAFLDQN
ncbi:MAG: thioredoxin fold domain-containing protein [Desulfosarcinaceae bacterium]|jgi:thioredoxin-related protein